VPVAADGETVAVIITCMLCTTVEEEAVRLGFFSWPIGTAHEAFTDPKRLGKRLSNEGHGFSRAVKGLRA